MQSAHEERAAAATTECADAASPQQHKRRRETVWQQQENGAFPFETEDCSVMQPAVAQLLRNGRRLIGQERPQTTTENAGALVSRSRTKECTLSVRPQPRGESLRCRLSSSGFSSSLQPRCAAMQQGRRSARWHKSTRLVVVLWSILAATCGATSRASIREGGSVFPEYESEHPVQPPAEVWKTEGPKHTNAWWVTLGKQSHCCSLNHAAAPAEIAMPLTVFRVCLGRNRQGQRRLYGAAVRAHGAERRRLGVHDELGIHGCSSTTPVRVHVPA